MPNCIDQFHNEHDIDQYLAESDDNIIICLEFEDNIQKYYCESRINLSRIMNHHDDVSLMRDIYGDEGYVAVMSYFTRDFYPDIRDLKDNFRPKRDMVTDYLENVDYTVLEAPEIDQYPVRGDTDTLLEIISSNQITIFQFWIGNKIDDFKEFLSGGSRFCKLTIRMKFESIRFNPKTRRYTIVVYAKITDVDGDFNMGDDPEAVDEDSGSEDSGVVEWDNDFFPG